jgi:tRNA pseudouridine-54 N-methylase
MTGIKEVKILRFIQLLPNTPPTSNFLNKDLPGSGKRIDILCRVLSACFDWGPSNFLETNLEVLAILNNSVTLTVSNPKSRLPSGEVAWGIEIRNSLSGNPPDFIQLESIGLDEVLNQLQNDFESAVFALDENGDPISTSFLKNTKTQNSFILGDHRGFDSESLRIIGNKDIQQISLGGMSYLSSHCVVALISKFERFCT